MQHSFDEVFVLHLANDYKRMDNINEQFNRICIKPTIWWTTKRAFSNKLAECMLNTLRHKFYDSIEIFNKDVYGNVFNCTLAHYDIIKTSLERGLNKILICGDDIEFGTDLQLIERYFTTFPDDYDIIKYHSSKYNYNNCCFGFNLYTEPYKEDDIDSTICYSLNRSGMEYFINVINQYFCASDNVFHIGKLKEVINIEIPKIYNINHKICWPKNYNSNIT